MSTNIFKLSQQIQANSNRIKKAMKKIQNNIDNVDKQLTELDTIDKSIACLSIQDKMFVTPTQTSKTAIYIDDKDEDNDIPISITDWSTIDMPILIPSEDVEISYMDSLLSKESFTPSGWTDCKDINWRMRMILVEWLTEVTFKFKLSFKTLCLNIVLIDEFIARDNTISRKKLQLLGLGCLMIAAKYEETYPPSVRDYRFICDQAYQDHEFIGMESLILEKLGFKLGFSTFAHFSEVITVDHGKETDLYIYLIHLSLLSEKLSKYKKSKMVKHLAIIAKKVMTSEKITDDLELIIYNELQEIAKNRDSKAIVKLYNRQATNKVSSFFADNPL